MILNKEAILMKRFWFPVAAILFLIATATTINLTTSTDTQAGGPHELVACLGCHSIHYALAEKIFGVKNSVIQNPRTKKGLDGMAAQLCLGCHNITQFGGAGIRPIHLHTTHPIGIVPDPKIANVPANLLRKGVLDCVSCHEIHPANRNPLYLRIDISPQVDYAEGYDAKKAAYENNPGKVQLFCTMCHPNKGDLDLLGVTDPVNRLIFSAMDERVVLKRTFPRTEAVTNNIKPYYVTPLGKYPPNTIANKGTFYRGNYEFVFEPTVDAMKLFDDIKKAPGYEKTSVVDKAALPPVNNAPMIQGKNRDTDIGFEITKEEE